MTTFTEDDFTDAQRCESLGPAYFSARRFVESAMRGTEAVDLKPLLKAHTDAVYRELQEAIENHLWSDAESNLQHRMWRTVDETVKALLSGEKWALERYALGSRYNHEEVRKAIAQHIPEEIVQGRIKDLEERIAQLTKDLEWERRR